MFANPPWILIPRILSEVRVQQATVILVAPVWKSQVWYPVLLSLLFDHPRLIQNNDLLDQLGRAHCFSTLDLAAGYWLICMDKQTNEKTAFVTQCGLTEFKIMPFGLTNAHAMLQHLMEKVLAGLKTENESSAQQLCAYFKKYLDTALLL